MCCRFFLEANSDKHVTDAAITAKSVAEKLKLDIKTVGDVYPTDIVPVIAPSQNTRTPVAFPMRWGFSHPKKESIFVFNTRFETAKDKDLFCTSVDDRRCLIPMSGYYEWKKLPDGKTEKYVFRSEEPFYLAGLYIRSSKTMLPCFSILTMPALFGVKDIHARMPVIVTEKQKLDWLQGKLWLDQAGRWSRRAVGTETDEQTKCCTIRFGLPTIWD